MATYVIGDLQGCYDELLTLLSSIDYEPANDTLWFAGDIVNRGPKSLECLLFVKQLAERGKAKMVLGNHDFHLLAAYAGLEKFVTKSDTLQSILKHDNVDELMDWLRKQPLLVQHDHLPIAMVHAGIPPQWDINQAQTQADEVAAVLQADDWQTALCNHLFGNEPKKWRDDLTGWERLRYSINAFARMRYCRADGKLEFKLKMAPEKTETGSNYQPWFTFKERKTRNTEIFFGHWSTLGARDTDNIHTTDTGCLWGGELTAYCIESRTRHTIKCKTSCQP